MAETREDGGVASTSTPDLSDPSTRHSSTRLSMTSSTSAALEQYRLLRSVAIGLVDQAIDLLQHVVVSDALLSTVSDLVPGSTIGKHLRSISLF
jgi:hypothetical protein